MLIFMKKYALCSLGNAIVDVLVQVTESEFGELGYEKGTMNLIDVELQAELIQKFQKNNPVLASGGSVANSVVTFAELGGKASFTGCVGDDKYGLFYNSEFEDFGIGITQTPIVNSVTGTCLALITPDSERTMRTCLGVSALLDDTHVHAETIQNSDWLFLEGYLFSSKEKGFKAVKKALEYAEEFETKVAVTFSDTWIIDTFKTELEEAVKKASLIFANEFEAMRYTGTSNREEAFEQLSKLSPIVIMTAGAEGTFLSCNGEKHHVKAYPAKPVDMTGAGDAFAGAFLYGISHNINPLHAVHCGCYLASKVISQVGARLHSEVRQSWDECISNLL